MSVQEVESLLGHGIYDVAEVARLVRRSPYEVSGWASREPSNAQLLLPRGRCLLSFYDLITAAVTAELRSRDVPLDRVRDARAWLFEELRVPWPFAHTVGLHQLATVGRRVYYREDKVGWLDASAGGQVPFVEVVTPLLRHLDFDAAGMASAWRPAAGVVLDPAVQAGAPCIEGTRMTTEVVADLVAAGEDPDDIAFDYDVDPDLIERALQYEAALATV